jgi:hypothetical protein
MESLINHLVEAQDPDSWLGSLDLSRKPDANLWLKAVEAISKEADDLLVDLRKSMAQLPDDPVPAVEAWELYFRTQARSEEIFRECLELLGGLALRDRMVEEYVCRFADELISECAEFVGKPTSFAIPAFEDALSSTLRRVARVGFPDWHLWTLPLVAYEYGQVVMRETNLDRLVAEFAHEASKETLDDLLKALESRLQAIDSDHIRRMARELISQAEAARYPNNPADKLDNLADTLKAVNEVPTGELAAATAGSIRECLDEANTRMQVLVSDAFATFTAGPAYACAALILRFNPTSPRRPGRPADAERAATILAVLAEMDRHVPPAFASVRENLASSWKLLTAGAGTDGDAAIVRRTESPMDARRALSRIRERVLKPEQAEYSKADWLMAQNLGTTWWAAISGGMPLRPSDDVTHNRLRDVFNAAWHCRLSIMDNVAAAEMGAANKKVGEVARQLCDRIIEQRKLQRGGYTFGGPAPRPN